MKENLTYNEIDRLVVRFHSKVSSEIEDKKLLEWVSASNSNHDYFVRSTQLLDSTQKPLADFDTQKAFAHFTNTISEKAQTKGVKLTLKPFLRIAASIIVLIGLGLTVLLLSNREVEEITLVSEVKILQEKLPDKTNIALQEGSKITYPSRFVKEQREVEVKGKVFFDVERNEKKPFVVHAGPVDIEVLGTSFDVFNDTILKTITVTVESGKVKVVYPEKNYVTFLNPQEQCIINWGEKVTTEEIVEDENYKGWLTGVMVFDSSPLSKVVRDLNTLYKKKIYIADQALNSCMLTTKIDNVPQDDVLGMLEKSLSIEVIDNGEMYILIGEGCAQ